jgi:hypothetical protein
MRVAWFGLLLGLLTLSLTNAVNAVDCPSGQTLCPDGLSCISPGGTCATATSTGDFGALAAGISGGVVGVGSAYNYPSLGSAESMALQECSQRTANCKVVGTFSNGGCGYITTAVTGTCWGSGESTAIALSECQSRGCGNCQAPIGGCTKRP